MTKQTLKSDIVQRLNILVVDDNQDAADTLAIMLRLKGNDVQVRYSGHEGVEAAKILLPDLVILDIGMPGLDGYQACRLIRASSGGEAIHIYALTGYGQLEDIRKSKEAGFDQHMLKPVDFGQLLNFIEEIKLK